jgi:hypothetical protein
MNGALNAGSASSAGCCSEHKNEASSGCAGSCRAASGGQGCGKTSSTSESAAIEASPATGARCEHACDGGGRIVYLSLDVEPWAAYDTLCTGCPVRRV